MHDRPAEPGCGICPHGRTCSTLRSLTARDEGCPTVTDIAIYAAMHRLNAEEVRALMAE
jgi:hypothetical protein